MIISETVRLDEKLRIASKVKTTIAIGNVSFDLPYMVIGIGLGSEY